MRLFKNTKLLVATALVAGLGLTACSGEPEDLDLPTAVEIPDTPAGNQSKLIIDLLNTPADVTGQQLLEQLSNDAKEQLGEPELNQLIDIFNKQLRPAKPFTPIAYQGNELSSITTLHNQASGPIGLTLNVDSLGKINGIFFGNPPVEHESATDIETLKSRLEALPVNISVLVQQHPKSSNILGSDSPSAESSTGSEDSNSSTNTESSKNRSEADLKNSAKPTEQSITEKVEILAINPEQPQPVASAAKLYVLSTLFKAIEAETITWETQLTITDQNKSLPSGELQNLPSGTVVTVREAAQKMIEISDNTATDLLINALARAEVEKTVAENRISDVSGLIPFTTTKELFELIWGQNRELAAQWTSGNDGAKLAVLNELNQKPLTVDLNQISSAKSYWQEGYDWFTTAADLSQIHLSLEAQAATHPEVREILGTNPGQGLNFDQSKWSYLGFKGGSMVGVLSLSWFAETNDGRNFTVVALLSTDTPESFGAEQQAEFFGLVEDLFQLL